jgi:hypothetical protein
MIDQPEAEDHLIPPLDNGAEFLGQMRAALGTIV